MSAVPIAGTVCYMAPETLNGQCGPPTDVWALGLILIEVYSGSPTILSPRLECWQNCYCAQETMLGQVLKTKQMCWEG